MSQLWSPIRVTDVLDGAAIEGTELAYGVTVANLQGGGFAAVLLVLRRFAERHMIVDVIVLTDPRRPANHRVGANPRPGIYINALADNRVGPHIDIRC